MAPAQIIEPKDLPPEVLGQAEGVEGDAHTGQDTSALVASTSVSFAEEPLPTELAASPVVLNMPGADWELGLEAEAMRLLVAGRTDVWDVLVNRVEARLIQTALVNTRGRRIEAAQKLGIGRNTITRKIQELGLDG
jgi:two-component system nitrogen regulation response regulator GlnG